MRILIVTQYFWPENFKVNDIAFDFVKKGYHVTVLTGIPNYPQGTFFKGYGFFKRRKECINGVNIIRVPLFPRRNGSNKYLIANYLSFVFFAFFTVFFKMRGKYDLVFSHLPSPLTSAIPAVWLKKKLKIPLVIWVLDLWPESVIANSNIRNKTLLKLLEKRIDYIYRNSDKILISSKSFKDSIMMKFGVESHKIEYFPNWAEDIFTLPKKEQPTPHLPELPEGFNIMFAGNIGESQDLEAVLRATSLTRESNINWVFIGDGRKVAWVKKQIGERKLTNVYMPGRYPLETMPFLFKQAHAMLVSLKDKYPFSLTVPAKVQAYMASGKIILGMVNGEAKTLINESGSGYAVEAGDFEALAEKALFVSQYSPAEKIIIEETSRRFYTENFSKSMLFSRLENVFKSV